MKIEHRNTYTHTQLHPRTGLRFRAHLYICMHTYIHTQLHPRTGLRFRVICTGPAEESASWGLVSRRNVKTVKVNKLASGGLVSRRNVKTVKVNMLLCRKSFSKDIFSWLWEECCDGKKVAESCLFGNYASGYTYIPLLCVCANRLTPWVCTCMCVCVCVFLLLIEWRCDDRDYDYVCMFYYDYVCACVCVCVCFFSW